MGTLENLVEIEILKDKVKVLEKALDKACEELEDIYYCPRKVLATCDEDEEDCKQCIKEYLLKESDKQ